MTKDAPKFTYRQKAAAIERELGYRRRVYPRRVAAQQMTQALADLQIAVFEAILADIQPLVGSDDEQRTML